MTERTITFHVLDQSIDWIYAEDIPPELPEAKKDGYLFDGWYIDECCTVRFCEENCMGSTDLYAKLRKI